nr:FxsB family radical SAM/SPASM domain protein [Pyrinomonadaceae bacterium]
MYSHADQSWRDQPIFMSEGNRRLLATRIGEYAGENEIEEIVVIFHGGEPLLAGVERIIQTADWIRAAVPEKTRADFSLQTNGTLLTEEVLLKLEKGEIGVSLSLDGPKSANDLHRVSHNGSSTYSKTIQGLRLLKARQSIYIGIIAVIDPSIPPRELLDFFDSFNPPSLDFLLPDANYKRPPTGREQNPDLYKNWLLEAFDLWFESYSHLPLRFFDAVLGAATGIPSETDAFGFGDVNLLTIETDGTYHDLDVLKITKHGTTNLGISLETHKIEDAASSKQIEDHRRLLCKEGLSATCQKCEVVETCGGGAIAHRYSKEGFDNPTIYCKEMLAILNHAKLRLSEVIDKNTSETFSKSMKTNENDQDNFHFDFSVWENAETAVDINTQLLDGWSQAGLCNFEIILENI